MTSSAVRAGTGAGCGHSGRPSSSRLGAGDASTPAKLERRQARRLHEAVAPVTPEGLVLVGRKVRGVLAQRHRIVLPEQVEVVLDVLHERRIVTGRHGDIGFQIVVADVAAGEIGRSEQHPDALGAPHDHELRVELLAVRAVPAHLDQATALAHEFGRDRPIRHTVPQAPEGVLVRIEDEAHRDAAPGRRDQCLDDAALGQVEHRDVDRIPGHRAVECFEHGSADRALRQELRRHRATGIRGEQARRPPADLPAGELRDRELAFQQIRHERPVDLEGDVRVRAARIVGICGTDEADEAARAVVGSANPHDASSAHSNVAFEIHGSLVADLLESELAVAKFSGWQVSWRPPSLFAANPGGTMTAQLLTESAIRRAVLEAFNSTVPGDSIDVAMFYLSERGVVETLIAAAGRGITVRLILDPNKDSFGRLRDGVPNRPVATELVRQSGGLIQVRWYRTHGEQFHTKLVVVRRAERVWMLLGSANLTRRNIGNYNLEADIAVTAGHDAPLVQDVQHYFDLLWQNDPVTLREYTSDFPTYEDQSFGRYWRYRLMEATGLSTF